MGYCFVYIPGFIETLYMRDEGYLLGGLPKARVHPGCVCLLNKVINMWF